MCATWKWSRYLKSGQLCEDIWSICSVGPGCMAALFSSDCLEVVTVSLLPACLNAATLVQRCFFAAPRCRQPFWLLLCLNTAPPAALGVTAQVTGGDSGCFPCPREISAKSSSRINLAQKQPLQVCGPKLCRAFPNLCLICFGHNADFNSSRLFPLLLVLRLKANLISLILASAWRAEKELGKASSKGEGGRER